MSGPELFGVVVRTGGFIFICQAFWHGLGALHPARGFEGPDYLPGTLASFALGAAILAMAEPIVTLAYFRKPREKAIDDDELKSP